MYSVFFATKKASKKFFILNLDLGINHYVLFKKANSRFTYTR